MSESLSLRLAAEIDLPALRTLMDLAIADLLKPFLPPEGVAASFEVMGLDSQLVRWSRRATLFGGDHSAGRDARMLDPTTEPARVRAMYTHPHFTRRGVGRRVLDACEAAARAEGFQSCEMAATLAGEPLYRACGYAPIEHFTATTSGGYAVPLVRMGKALV
ncbi:MAG: GNAT family N-acetyltransferase [Caulobacterales bacterium]|nr:GNAT family N-acetyltransferase [Caulobacterales bacterium]